MARYVILIRFTDKGARHIKKSPERGVAFRKTAEKAGIALRRRDADGLAHARPAPHPLLEGSTLMSASSTQTRATDPAMALTGDGRVPTHPLY